MSILVVREASAMTGISYADRMDSVPTGGIDAVQDSLRNQLARMSDGQLQRLLLLLDERGAATGRSFAVHQGDPGDACSRELVELTLGEVGALRCRQTPRLRLVDLGSGNPQAVTSAAASPPKKLGSAAVLTLALATYIGIWISALLAVGWLMGF
jgi:hypothetical protein